MTSSVELRDVVNRFGAAYVAGCGKAILPSQKKALADIVDCRTPPMGGRRYHCQKCDKDFWVYHGCRNRACPACHGRRTREWVAARQTQLLGCGYYHVVATVPAPLRVAFLADQKRMYGLLLKTVADCLIDLARDPRYAGGLPAVMAVLHTWARDLQSGRPTLARTAIQEMARAGSCPERVDPRTVSRAPQTHRAGPRGESSRKGLARRVERFLQTMRRARPRRRRVSRTLCFSHRHFERADRGDGPNPCGLSFQKSAQRPRLVALALDRRGVPPPLRHARPASRLSESALLRTLAPQQVSRTETHRTGATSKDRRKTQDKRSKQDSRDA